MTLPGWPNSVWGYSFVQTPEFATSPFETIKRAKEGSLELEQEEQDKKVQKCLVVTEERTRKLIQGPKMYSEGLKHLNKYLALSRNLAEDMVN